MSAKNNNKNTENKRDIDFPFGEPKSQEDEPIENLNSNEGYVRTQELSPQQIKEKDKDRNDKKYFKAYDLIKICLIFLAMLSIFDYTMLGITNRSNSNMSTVFEILKALLYTLSGYLFAERKNDT